MLCGSPYGRRVWGKMDTCICICICITESLHHFPETITILLSGYAAAKSFQSCPTLCNPIDGSHQAPPSLGFSRIPHWSGLSFPSPMHESEKWKGSCLLVSDSLQHHGLQPTRFLRPWDFPGKNIGVGCHCLLCNWLYLNIKWKGKNIKQGFLALIGVQPSFQECILNKKQ